MQGDGAVTVASILREKRDGERGKLGTVVSSWGHRDARCQVDCGAVAGECG